MNLPQIEKPKAQQIDVSPRALAIARRLDRLKPGTYMIRLEKTDGADSQWAVEIDGMISVYVFKAGNPASNPT